MSREGYFVLDFETTNLNKGDPTNKDNRVVLASVYHSVFGIYQTFEGSQYDLYTCLEPYVRRQATLVAHNAKFELQWLSRIGFEWKELRELEVFDTLLADYVVAGNRRWAMDLDSCMKRNGFPDHKGGAVKALIKGGVCPSEIPRNLLAAYCELDVCLTKELFLKQAKQLESLKLTHIHRNRCETSLTLAEMELQGMPLGEKDVNLEAERTIQRYEALQAELDTLSGGLNWDSTKQVAAFIYGKLGFGEHKLASGELDRTDTGKPKTDEDTITRLKPATVHQEAFLNLYREFVPLKKRRQSVEKFKAVVDERSRVYAGLNQSITQTHRLSSTGKRHKIQFQNFDRSLKYLVQSDDPDFYIAESDGVQLEFRVAAHLGRDMAALKDILDGRDIHKFSGSVIFQKPESEIVGELRTAAKAETFKPLYGGSSGSDRQRAYYKAFREHYSGIYNTQKKWTYEVAGKKQLRTEYGLVFYWPETKILDSGYITNTPSIFNYPVQGFATAEIIPISLNLLRGLLSKWGMRSYLINTVHDSVIAMVHKDEVEKYAEACKQAFTSGTYKYLDENYGIKLTVPLGVEIKIGKHWGDDSIYKTKYEENPEWLVV